ncbi:MAG: cytochrome c biogenesis protein CcsA [Rikenellaceae bacterium]
MLLKIINSPRLMILLLVIYALALAAATFIEKYHGTAISQSCVYHSLWFISLQLLMVVNGVAIMKSRGLFSRKSIGSLLLHLSFVVILAGALTTHLFGREGYMHIREAESVSSYVDSATNQSVDLDFSVRLDNFVISRYAGSNSPSSFQSYITITKAGRVQQGVVQTNKIVNVDGYRLFQTSFDKDEGGTLLTVNYDFPGMQITYLGYAMLLLGILLLLFQPRSRFRMLLKRLGKAGCLAAVMLWPAATLSAQNSVGAQQAQEFGRLMVQNNKGRLEPMNTWSSKIVRKIYGEQSYKGFTSDQLLLNLFLLPFEWAEQDIIEVKNRDIRAILGCQEYTHYNNMFDKDGLYRLQEELDAAYEVAPSSRSKLQKDLISLDEVVNVIYQIQDGGMMPIFPHPTQSSDAWISPNDPLEGIEGQDSLFLSKITLWYAEELYAGIETGDYTESSRVLAMISKYQRAKSDQPIDQQLIDAELRYNRLSIFSGIIRFYMIFGALLLLVQLVAIFRGEGRVVKILSWILLAAIALIFALHSYGIALRWQIAGHGPWSNSYETMIFVAWSAALIGLVFARRAAKVTALATLLCGVLLFVSSLNWMNPEISPLVPVLQSYWLMLHVAVIMLSYGFLFVSMLTGLANIVIYSLLTGRNSCKLLPAIERTTIIGELSMILGVSLLAIGIFLGAVWANVSWGRYWGWDPKETWALITLIVYVGILHMRFIPRLDNPWLFNVKSSWAILSVLMTYFGVNHYLSGMHSYGNTDGSLLWWPLIVGLLILIVLTATSYLGYRVGKGLLTASGGRG